jgi:hypothetical protein
MKDIFYFGRRSDNDPKATPSESKFRCFHLHCQKCDSYRVRVELQYDETSGESALLFICSRCHQQEKIIPGT